MLQSEIKSNFVELGNFLRQFSEEGNVKVASVLQNDLFFDEFANLIELSQSHNGWFTPEQVQFSVQSWAKALTEENLNQWLSNYDFSKTEPKKIGLILMILASSALVACGAKKDDGAPVKSTSKSTSAIKKPTPSKSSETPFSSDEPISSETLPSSNQTVKTSDVQGSDLTKARLSLYEAGVNSSSISSPSSFNLFTSFIELFNLSIRFLSFSIISAKISTSSAPFSVSFA